MKHRHKAIIVGDAGVGKSSLEECCLGRVEHYKPDIGSNELTYAFKEIKDCVLNVWDIREDKEDCRELNIRLFKNAHLVLMVFDVNKRETFENLDKWVDVIIENNNLELLPPTIIIGNKIELREGKDGSVTKEEGMNYASALSKKHEVSVVYTEVSVEEKDGVNILPELIYDQIMKFESNPKFKNITLDPTTKALVENK